MNLPASNGWSAFVLLLLCACSAVPPGAGINGAPQSSGVSQCAGTILSPPPGLEPTEDPALLQLALGQPTQGKLCKGQVLVAQKPVLVYRIWQQARPESLYGSWWSFSQPTGSRAAYRIDNAICPAWSSLDMVSVCQIKVGSKLVVGPGQSADCPADQLKYAASPVNQVYLPNNRQQQLLQVENCSAGQAWPEH